MPAMSQYPDEEADKFHKRMMGKMGGGVKSGSMVRAANRYMMSAEEKKNKANKG